MKILIVQLARLGEIYQTWPAVKKFAKENPDVEIHYLTRESFKDAVVGLTEVKTVKTIPAAEILEPVIIRCHIEGTQQKTESFLSDLINEKYDHVYNLTYSASSASLCAILEEYGSATVHGYSRNADSFLKLNDDIAEYFYAQVGIGRNNRIHLTDLFAWQMGVNLEDGDFDFSQRNNSQSFIQLSDKTIAIQIGASQVYKSMGASHWIEFIRQLSLKGYESFCLLGSPGEVEFAESIVHAFPAGIVKNLVGQFKVYQHFSILKQCQLLVAVDSSMIHIASLVGVPCANISIGAVNFWETGPRTKNSNILRYLYRDEIKVSEVVHLVDAMILGNDFANSIKVIEGCPAYFNQFSSKVEEFSWNFVRALYMESSYPIVDDLHSLKAFHSFFELNKMILNEIRLFRSCPPEAQQVHLDLMKSMESTLDLLSQKSRAVMPLWSWIVGQRVRISNLSGEKYVESLDSIHQIAESVLKLYVIDELVEESEVVK